MNSSETLKVLLLSAYDADSHCYWRRGLEAYFSQWQWTVLSLPGRYFSWRVRGNSLSWAFQNRAELEADYDLLITTSMCDLSALRGFVPKLGQLPTLVYFHENQFSYPASKHQNQSLEPQLLSLYTGLCGDRIVFNSHYNRDTFLSGAGALLKKFPDQVPKGLLEKLRAKSLVLPVPVNAVVPGSSVIKDIWPKSIKAEQGRPVRILWAARWEYDKGPDRLLAILTALSRRGIDFQLCLLGQRFRQWPEEFDQIKDQYVDQLVQWGYETSSERYQAWLSGADLVLSTAIHEFQGISVQEAIAAGCLPVLPGREVYAELVDPAYLYPSYLDDIDREAEAAVDLISDLSLRSTAQQPRLREVLGWPQLGPQYHRLCLQLIAESAS